MEITQGGMEEQFGGPILANRLDTSVAEIGRHITSIEDASNRNTQRRRKDLLYYRQQAPVEVFVEQQLHRHIDTEGLYSEYSWMY